MKWILALLMMASMAACTPVQSTVAGVSAKPDAAEITSSTGATVLDDGNIMAAANDKGLSYAYLNRHGLTNLQQIPFDVTGITGTGVMAGATASFDDGTITFKHYEVKMAAHKTPAREEDGSIARDNAGEVVWIDVPASTQHIALVDNAHIQGYNNNTAAVLAAYAPLLDRDVERLKAMEESERVVFVAEIKGKQEVYGTLLENLAKGLDLLP